MNAAAAHLASIEALKRQADAVSALAASLDVSSAEIAQMLVDAKGRVLVVGVGTSRSVATRMAHLLCCVGRSAFFLHPADSLHGAAGAVVPGDVVVAISKGGSSSEVNDFVRIARGRGAGIIAITEKRQSDLVILSDKCLWTSSPKGIDPYGMIAIGSSMVASAACDALCLMVLELGGYTLEEFSATHPGGAVGEQIRVSDRAAK